MQLRAAAMLAFTLTELGPAALAQQLPQSQLDCESARNYGDPRCQVLMRPPVQGGREDLSMPSIPVIRDQGTTVPQYDINRFERGRFADRQILDSREPLPPEEPTEFQRFVERSVGRLLPVFGQNLFEHVPSTFAPADRVPVTPEYLVGPGDQLLVRGWGQIDLNVSPVVDRSGAVYIPQVGQLNVAGLKFAQVQDYLKTAVSRVYRNFDLSVNMGQLRSMQVFVVGHARRPGVYTVSSLSTLVNAVFASGGPDAHGSMRNIRLTRLNRVVAELDLYDLLLDGNKSGDRPLLPGDVIYIPPVGPQVALTGSVNTPALYELKESSTLKEALQLAGGLTPVAVKQQAVVERIGGSGRSVLQVPLEGDGAGETSLRNGDIVNVLAIVPRYDNAVTLRGNVADPIRMPWHSGMRVRDLIPDRHALLTRDYWTARNLLVTPEPRREGDRNAKVPVEPTPPERSDEIAADRGIDRTAGDARNVSTAYVLPDAPTSLSAPRTGSRVVAPGSIAATKSDSAAAKHRVTRNELEVNWSYAVIERQDPKDLRTTLIPFNLGKAIIDGDEAENVPLEPGDIVNVFSIADLKVPQAMQTRYVRLEGEFGAAGVYSVRPGETLRALVSRAGGLTPQAYLFGSEFLRESSRTEQQQRLDDFVNSVERQVESSGANVRGSVLSLEDAGSAASQLASQREFVRKLREVRATGRIVLALDPRVPGVAALPDLELEDGDVFVVPSRPAFVNVVGSVYNGSSLLYEEDKRLGDYLRESGGPTRTADGHHTFLIRADGSVVSKTWASNVLTRSFEGVRLNPGDTIVVPEQLNKTTFLKELKDWSQIFAQFGLGAAAINVLR